MQKNQLHIGRKILEKLESERLSMSWLAHKVGCDRSNLRKKLHNNHLELDLLFAISHALHEDFFAPCSRHIVENSPQNCGNSTTDIHHKTI